MDACSPNSKILNPELIMYDEITPYKTVRNIPARVRLTAEKAYEFQ